MTVKNIILAMALAVAPVLGFAQNKTNEALSTEYKYKINVLKSEIKTLKAKMKAEPTNATYVVDLNSKKAELKVAQNEKKIIDKAIKTEKKQKKAAEKAEKALKAAEKAAKDADELKASKKAQEI
ncbi:MAG: hypothetical protein MJY81_01760 [Bacteroidaceae bacterium]|nr:hypothetical protein [Bacteroidaceae bacterium]